MNSGLALLDGIADPPLPLGTSLPALEWPSPFPVVKSEPYMTFIRRLLFIQPFDKALTRYEHFCRAAWLALLIHQSPFEPFIRALDQEITYSPLLLAEYLGALPVSKRLFISKTHIDMWQQPIQLPAEYEKLKKRYKDIDLSVHYLLAFYGIAMIIPPSDLPTILKKVYG